VITPPSSIEWQAVLERPRRPTSTVARLDIPAGPGVYAWFQGGECVYLGKATSLRSRLGTHLGTSLDLSRSTLRSWVAVRELGLDRAHTRHRPSLMTEEQVGVVNQWIQTCELAWIETDTKEEAAALESRLLADWRPPINVA
jgi:hypothetical protein